MFSSIAKPSRIIGDDFETIDEDLGVPDKIITLDIKTFEGYETNYAENFEYESTVNIYTDRTETTTQTLTRLHTPEGYITTVSSPQYHYYRRDHLGNNREVWLANTNTTLQRTQYYPSGLPWAEGLGAGVQNKKYNGKEFVEMHGWDEYDSEARWMYPAIMRTSTLDPLAEKYYSISPYAWCGNNPVKFVDPDGMVVEDPDEIYKKQKKQISDNLKSINQMLKSDGLSKEMQGALKSLAGEYATILNEFSSLEKSDQVYNVFSTDEKEGGVKYQNGKVMIGIGDKSIGLIGHELKHAYQFEIGEISFRIDGKGFGSLYDISDETAAYNRERLLATGIQFIQSPDKIVNGYPLKMNNDNVRSFGLQMNPPAYQTLPNGPINTNSPEGQHLQRSSFLQGFTRMPLGIEVSRGLFYSRGFNSK